MKKLGIKAVGALAVTGATTLIPVGLVLGRKTKSTVKSNSDTTVNKPAAIQKTPSSSNPGSKAGQFAVDNAIKVFSDQTTTKTTVEASSIHIGSTSPKDLGISPLTPPTGVIFTYEVTNNTGNGILEVKVIATKGSATSTKEIKISGFKSDPKVDQATVDQITNSLTDQTTSKTTVGANVMHMGVTSTIDLGISLIPSAGVTFAYEVTDNTGDGFVNVKVTATKGSATSTTNIKVNGFLSAANIAANAAVTRAINSLKNTITSLKTTLPSTFSNGPTTQNALGTSIVEEPNVKYEYSVIGTADGEVIVQVTLTNGPIIKTKTIKVTGFKTKAQVDQDLVDSTAKALAAETTTKTSIGASSINMGATTETNLGISHLTPPLGVTFAYEVTDNTGDGFVNVKVTVIKNSATSTTTIKVNGFKTQAQVDQDTVDKITGLLTDQTTNKGNDEASTIAIAATTKADLGISLTPPLGVTFAYEVTDNTGDGFVNVKVTATKGSATSTTNIKVNGFLTVLGKANVVANATITKAINALKSTTTSLVATLPSTFKNGITTQKALGTSIVEEPNVKYEYSVIGAADGEVTVEVTLTDGPITKTKIIKVSGFKTQLQVAKDFVTSTVNSLQDQSTSKTTTMASSISQGVTTPTNLGISPLTPPAGVTFTYEVTDNTKDGFLEVEVTATKGAATATSTIKVNGFKTQLQADQVSVDNVVNSLKDIATSKVNTDASTIPVAAATTTDLGISLIPPSGIALSYEVTDNTGDGFLNVKVTATKGAATATKDIKIIWFLSNLSKANQATTNGINALKDTTTSRTNTLTSTFKNGLTTQNELGTTIAEIPGVTYKYEILKISMGELFVKVTLTKGSITKIKTIKVIGFKTQSQIDQGVVNATINSLTDQTTTKSKVGASEISKGSTTEPDLGISLTPPAGVVYTYEVTDNTGDGFVNVKVTATKGLATSTTDIKVNGFKTQAKVDQDAVNTTANALTDLSTNKITDEASTIKVGTTTASNLGISLISPVGMILSYEVTDNAGDGFLEVKITVTKNSATATKTIKITGFITKLDKVNIAMTNAMNSLRNTATSLATTLPSTFKSGPTTQSKLGTSIVEQNGITYAYKVIGTSDGEVDIQVTLTDGPVTKTKIIKVNGFKTQAQVAQDAVDQIANALKNQVTGLSGIKANAIPVGALTTTNLGITLTPPAGVTFAYKVTNNKGDGFVEVEVTVIKGPVRATASIQVTGFKTQLQIDQKIAKASLNSILDQTTNRITDEASTINKGAATTIDLGISLIPPSGVTFAYEVTDNTGDGFLQIEVTATKNKATATKTIKVNGFLTAAGKIIATTVATVTNATKALTDTSTSLTTIQTSVLNNGPTTQSILGTTISEQNGVIYEYNIINTLDGEVEVEVTLTKGSITKTKTIKVTGFKTQAQADQDAVSAAVKTLKNVGTTKTTVGAFTVSQGPTVEANLGISLTPPAGVTYAYEVTDNTGDGFLKVKVTAIKASARATTNIQITGFKIQSRIDQELVAATIKTLTNQTTNKGSDQAITISMGTATTSDLGISLTPPTGITISYEVTDNTGDGFLEVRVTATKNKATATKTINVNGFLTKIGQANTAANTAITNALNALTDTTTSLATIQSSTLNNGVATQAKLGTSIVEQNGITYSYKVVSTSDGEASVEATLIDGPIIKSKIIKITGFKNQVQADQDDVSTAIKALSNIGTTKTTVGASTIPTGPSTPSDLGITLTPPPGVTYAYEVTDNTKDGLLEIKITVRKGSATSTTSIQVTGFKTQTQFDQDFATTTANALSDQITNRNSTEASTMLKGIATNIDLGIPILPPTGVTYDYKITDNTGDGFLEVEVTVAKNKATATKTIKVSGFLTLKARANIAVGAAINVLKDTTTSLTTIQSSTLKNVVTSTQSKLGTSIVEQNGITYSYKVVSTSDGEASVEVTLIDGPITQSKIIQVTGFKTQAQVDQDLVASTAKALSNIGTTKTTVGASTIPTGPSTPSDLGITLTPPPGVTYAYEVTDNTKDGLLEIKITVRKGSAHATTSIQVTGFKTQTQFDQDFATATANAFPDQTTSKTTVEASTVSMGTATTSDLGISLTPPTGMAFAYKVTNNKGDGFLEVEVTVTKGKATATKTIKVNGFLTALKRVYGEVATAIKALSDTTTSLTTIQSSTLNNGATTQKALGTAITEQNGITYSYKIIRTSDGEASVEATLTDGPITQSKIIKVTGFKTQAKIDQETADAAARALTDTNTTKSTVKTSAIVASSSTAIDLGISLTPPSGITYSYEVTDNTKDGFLEVEVTVTKNKATATKTIKVNGFQTKAQVDQNAVDSIAQSLSDQTTSKITVEASTISMGTASENDLGITLTPPPGATYSYKVTDNTKDGFLEVEVIVTKNKATATKTIQINGFLTTKAKANIAVATAIKALSDTTTSLATTLPSTFKSGPTTQANLGTTITEQNGITYSYKVVNTLDGEVDIEITLTDGPITQSKTIKVTGFKTKAQVNQDLVDASTKALVNQVTTKTTIEAQMVPTGATTPTLLGITLTPPPGITFDYKVTTKADGEVDVEVTATRGAATSKNTIKVTGFKTQAKVDQDIASSMAQSLTDQTTSNGNVGASTIPMGVKTKANLGISLTPPTGMAFAYKVTNNKGDGFLEVEVTVTKGKATATKTIKVNGFLTKIGQANIAANAAVTKAINALLDTTTSLTTIQSSTFSNIPTTQKALGTTITEQNGITYSYKVVSTLDGEASVEVTLTDGPIIKSKTIKVTGFKTQAKVDQDTADATAKSLIDQITDKSVIVASAIHKGPSTKTILGISLISPVGMTFTYKVTDNTGDGFLEVEVTVTKGKATATKTIKVTGFKTQAKVDQETVDAVVNVLANTSTTKSTVLPSTIHKGTATTTDLGISLTPPAGMTFTYKVTDNTKDGFLEVEVTVAKGSASATKSIRITRFLTIIDNAFNALSDTTTSLSTTLASTFANGPTTQKALGTTITEQPGVTYRYKIVGNKVGEVSIETTIIFGSATKTKTIKVTGFRDTKTITVYIYNKIEYLTRAEAEAAANGDEEAKITSKQGYIFNNKWYATHKDAEAAQLSLKPVTSQTWKHGTQPVDGSTAPATTTDHTVYQYKGKVYETEDLASNVWINKHNTVQKLGSATIKYDGQDLPALSIDSKTASMYSSDADVKKEYGGKLSWAKTSTSGVAGQVSVTTATKFTKAQVYAELSKPISGEYSIDGRVYQKVVSAKTGKVGTFKDVIAATKNPVYSFTSKGQEYVAVTHFDQADDMMVMQDGGTRLDPTGSPQSILDYFNKVKSKEYATWNALIATETHMDAMGGSGDHIPLTPPPGVQLMLETLKHLKSEVTKDPVKSIHIYEDEFKNYFRNIPSAHPDQPYYDMFSRIIPKSFYDRSGGGKGGSEISDTAASDNFKFFHMSVKNLDAVINFLDNHKTQTLFSATYGYEHNAEVGIADHIHPKNSGNYTFRDTIHDGSWIDKIFAPTVKQPVQNSLSLIALGDQYGAFKFDEQYISGFSNGNKTWGRLGKIYSGRSRTQASFWTTEFLKSDGSQDRRWGSHYLQNSHHDGWHIDTPVFFDSKKTVIYTKANFLASYYDKYKHVFYTGALPTTSEPSSILDRSSIGDIASGTYYKDSTKLDTYTTTIQPTSIGYNKTPDITESRVDHYELKYNGKVVSGITKDLPWTSSKAPTAPTIDPTKVTVPQFTPFVAAVTETKAHALASGDIKTIVITNGFNDVHSAGAMGTDVVKVIIPTGPGFSGFVMDGKFYSTKAAAVSDHSSEIVNKDKFTYSGTDYLVELDAIKAADSHGVTLVTTKSKIVPVSSAPPVVPQTTTTTTPSTTTTTPQKSTPQTSTPQKSTPGSPGGGSGGGGSSNDLQKLIDDAEAGVQDIINGIKGIPGAVADTAQALPGAVTGFVQALPGAVTGTVQGLGAIGSGAASALTGAAKALPGVITGAVQGLPGAVTGTVQGLAGAVTGAVQALPGAVTGTVQGLGAIATAAGSALSSAASSASNAVSSVTHSVSHTFHKLFGPNYLPTRSPSSRVMSLTDIYNTQSE